MSLRELVRVFVKGGIISTGDFYKVLLVAEKLGAAHINLGSRQDILFPSKETKNTALDQEFEAINGHYEINTFQYQNIASSYVAQEIVPGKQWLASHIYHYILDSFDYRPKLRINIVDSSQSLVPLFTGQINFLASNQENFWYVYLRCKEINIIPYQLPLLVFSEDLVKIARCIEKDKLISKGLNYKQIFDYLTKNLNLNTQPVTESLSLPDINFPYYEGINRISDGKYWLGLYWRNNEYSISILKAIIEKAIATNIGNLSLTPWKSFVIKGIFEKDRMGWEKLLGRFGMNLRHSALELNWHLPALSKPALHLKFYLVRELDKMDISTYGLTFTIKTSDDITLFTSIVIEFVTDETFNILYSKDFNPNLNNYKTYAMDVPKTVLASLIVELSKMYFENFKDEYPLSSKLKTISDNIQKELYQCIHCQTVYDSELGDPNYSIREGTSFAELPNEYCCSTCGGPKTDFERMKMRNN
ncbi:MAG: rubredoxin [Bacteroidota bacterium]